MAQIQIAHSIGGRCIERLVQLDYDSNGNTITVPISPWRPCNPNGRYWGGRITGTTDLPSLGPKKLISRNATLTNTTVTENATGGSWLLLVIAGAIVAYVVFK